MTSYHTKRLTKQQRKRLTDNLAVATEQFFTADALEQLARDAKFVQRDSKINGQNFFNIIVLNKESICFQIDESLAASLPGSGGSGSAAAMRIQFEYDFLNGHINDLSVQAFNNQDATDSIETLELTQQADLIIPDLAYMNLGVIKRLIDKGAFLLCRLQYNVTIYEMKDNSMMWWRNGCGRLSAIITRKGEVN